MAALLIEAEDVRRNVLFADPDQESAARDDMKAAVQRLDDDEIVKRIIRLADLWMLLVADLLGGIGLLLRDRTTVFPVFPLLRAAIEHAAWVCWILDPRVGSRDRARRAALSLLRSDEEIVGVVKRWAGPGSAEYRSTKERLKATRDAVRREFGDLDPDKNTIEGHRNATPTEVVQHLGSCMDGDDREWRGTYDYLCGTATHPSQNAYEFFELDADGRPHLALTDDFVNRLARIGSAVFLHSLSHYVSYLGWRDSPLRAYQERVSTVLENQSEPE